MSSSQSTGALYARIRQHPKFAELVSRRSRYATTLSVIVLVMFYGFVLAVAFKPALIGARIAPGSTLTIGVAAGLFIFVSFWLLTAMYVRRANTEFDAITQEIVRDATAAGGAR